MAGLMREAFAGLIEVSLLIARSHGTPVQCQSNP